MCISFGQSCNIRREFESRGMGADVRSVEEMRTSSRLMVNQIQDRCWSGRRPFTIDEVHVAWAIRPDGGAEDALTLKMCPDMSSNEYILVDT